MQDKDRGIKSSQQTFSSGKCTTKEECSCKSGVDGAFTPTSIVEWLTDNLSAQSHLGKLEFSAANINVQFIFCFRIYVIFMQKRAI